MPNKEWNPDDYNDLVGVVATNLSFKLALERSDKETIKKALDCVAGHKGQQEKELAFRRRLREITKKEGINLETKEKAVTATINRQKRPVVLELATLQAEVDARDQRTAEQAEREKMIAQCHEVVGRVQAADMFVKLGTVASLVWLKEMKEAKIYRELPAIGTWDKFCDYLKKDRRTVDEDLQNLSTFGENFLETCRQLSIGYRELRKLRQLAQNGTVTIDAECITIGEETIPINVEHADDLQAAIERIIEAKTKLNQRVEKLEKGLNEAVKEETQGLKAEVTALVNEVKRLKPFDPEEKDRNFALEQVKAISTKVTELSTLCFKFMVDERVMDDPVLLGQVEGCFNSAELMLRDTRKRWEQVVSIFED